MYLMGLSINKDCFNITLAFIVIRTEGWLQIKINTDLL